MSRRTSMRFGSSSQEDDLPFYGGPSRRVSFGGGGPSPAPAAKRNSLFTAPAYHDAITEEDEFATRSRHYNPTPAPPPAAGDDDDSAGSSDSDSYDETLFQKYQASVMGASAEAAHSIRGSALGQGGAASRRTTQGTWVMGGRRSSAAAGSPAGNRRNTRGSVMSGGGSAGGGRRASVVANLSLMPMALRRLTVMTQEQDGGGTGESQRSVGAGATSTGSLRRAAGGRRSTMWGQSAGRVDESQGSGLPAFAVGDGQGGAAAAAARRASRAAAGESARNLTFAAAVLGKRSEGAGAGGEVSAGELDEITMALKRTEAIAERRTSALAEMKTKARDMVFKRKRIFLELSMILGVVSLVVVVAEMVTLLQFELVPVTFNWLFSFLLIHVLGFQLFILAIVHAAEAQNGRKVAMAALAGFLNTAAFVLRCVLVFSFWDYVPDNTESNFF
ncbi:hypothetical protein HDU96_006226 [Phlyctochytrium bullatum]|nr:hypothetical protein HDU96_006226 [Phlyctochytrium bullatum]